MRIEVDRIGVHGEKREPRVIGRRNRSTERMANYRPDFKILEAPSTSLL